MLPHLKFASSSRWKWGTGRTRPQFPSLLTPGAVFPAQAGIRPKSNLLPAHQDGSTGVPWLTEAELELLPSCPKLPHRAWEKPFSWKCCFTQSRSYQSTSSVVTKLQLSHPGEGKARRGRSKVSMLLVFECHTRTQCLGKWLCLAPRGCAAGNT